MKFGLFINAQHPVGESVSQRIAEASEQTRLAREAGFDMICAGQHYLSHPYQMSAIIPLLARLTADAEGMEIAATVLLIPLLNPVDVAETCATLDAMSGGRFVLGIGIGYRDEEYTAFGIQRSERIPRLIEAMDIIRLLWTEDEVEYNGTYYKVPKVRVATRPVQKPHPPIWVAANGPPAIARAARWGYPWVINPHATIGMISGQLDYYRKIAAEAGQPMPATIPMMRELYVAPDSATAYAESRPYLESKYAAYAAWGQDKAMPEGESFSVPFDQLARDRFLIGNPEEVVREIQRYRDELGVNHLNIRVQWPGMPHANAMRQLEILGKEVLPKVPVGGPEKHEGRAMNQLVIRDHTTVGIAVPQMFPPGPTDLGLIREHLALVEQLGYESVWTQHGVFATSPNLDPFTLLAFAASCTRTIKLGISVVVLPYHDPVNVAKISASLDQISGGRLILGVGIGGDGESYPAFGFDASHRIARFEDAVTLIRRLWAEPSVDFQNRFWNWKTSP